MTFTNKGAVRGEEIELNAASFEGDKSKVKSVLWYRRDDDDQLRIVQTSDRIQYIKGGRSNPSLTIKQICMNDGGRYCNFVVLNDGQILSCGWKLQVIPQGIQESSFIILL